MSKYFYKVGGCLRTGDSNYVLRSADLEVYRVLKAGQYCYVFNSRQMGKSSLLVRMRHNLQQEGYHCAFIDMTRIASDNINSQQWCKGIIISLWSGLKLVKCVDFNTWWRKHEDLSMLQRLSLFIEDILLVNIPQGQIVIFFDEIDSILGLNFAVDDFFAWIRFCYDQRALNLSYNRLCFALFGVARPDDLIQDKTRTPFNIGQAIDLQEFKLEEAEILAKGFETKVNNSQGVLAEIMAWTGGQPFLTQKLCQLVIQTIEKMPNSSLMISPGTEASWVENVVRESIIDRWELQDEPEHLRTIRDRILRNEQCASRMLSIYQQILQNVEVPVDDSREQIELLLSGLVVKQQGYLQIKNRIYQEVFNLQWLEKQLAFFRR
ncbi:AAA-like domain-containing protein [Fischerella sp. PCC 9605]|uniref:AAA-like domain-containing protein n=1 Tax=Fischerella sp. PCC 9605 TaxID=1173024 RepID=UPI0009E4D209|nr:AAA-like domain-containing protein [Fischerella sp. PCC 9605]